MDALKKLDRKKYTDLRKKVRKNALINSKVAESKRELFYDRAFEANQKKFIVGGLVLEKNYRHSCSLYDQEKGWRNIPLKEIISSPQLPDNIERVETQATLVLFDFSGVFTVIFSPPPMGFAFVKESDVVYAAGDIFHFTLGGGPVLCGKDILSQEEMEQLQKKESFGREEDFFSRADVSKIRKTSCKKDLGFLVESGASPEEILSQILKQAHKTEPADLFWVVSSLYDFYNRFPRRKLYQLVEKYFFRWIKTQQGFKTKEDQRRFLYSLFTLKQEIKT